MDFICEDKTYTKYYDEFVVLLRTGMRVSEFCGLTKCDLDFINRKIRGDREDGKNQNQSKTSPIEKSRFTGLGRNIKL